MQLLKTFALIAMAAGLVAAQADPKHPGGCPNVDTCNGRVCLPCFPLSLSLRTLLNGFANDTHSARSLATTAAPAVVRATLFAPATKR